MSQVHFKRPTGSDPSPEEHQMPSRFPGEKRIGILFGLVELKRDPKKGKKGATGQVGIIPLCGLG